MYIKCVEMKEIRNTRMLLTNSIGQSCIWFRKCQRVWTILRVMIIACWKAERLL